MRDPYLLGELLTRDGDILGAIDTLANQLCVAVDGNFDFAVRSPVEHETLEKLSMLMNFVLDTARRGMSALRDHNEALAELDRAKTTFFSNISHELRTPLTLMLGPLEDVLAGKYGDVPPEGREQLAMAHRNAMRLLKLVNTLLEFSRIEAGRWRAAFEPVDLAAYTADVAGVFRAAVERAELRFVVDCAPLPEPIYVDREMWEKIVLNLLSNALKHTFEGEIAVTLDWTGGGARLRVRDTGVGISAENLPRIFERFHRIAGVRARSHEGTGIGLALAQELVKLHGGTLHVTSEVGHGSTFEIRLPAGRAHLRPELVREHATSEETMENRVFVEEALQWSRDLPQPVPSQDAARVLVVDDNADMRSYLSRLLGQRWKVEVVEDGLAALEAVRRQPPDLVLTDVMMPGLDGFGLLRALREDERTRELPIIMLSARAGEDAKVEGHEAGADDYIVKPFTGRELVARIASQLSLRELRRGQVARELAESRFNAALYRVSTMLVSEVDAEKVLQLITDETTTLVAAQFGAFFFNARRPDGEAYLLYTLSGAKKDSFKNFPLPRVTPLFAPTFRGEKIVRLDDVRRDPRFGAWGKLPPGHVEVVSYLAVPVVGPSGEVFGALFFGHDEAAQFTSEHERIVTAIATQAAVALEKARLYAELRDSERRAREADRRKDEFLAMLGHELRNPLAPMLTAVEILHSEGVRAREVDVLDRQIRHMMRLVDDLLDISRITRGTLQLEVARIDLHAVVLKGIEMASPLLEQRQHALSLEMPTGLWVDGDAVRLAQVVANLLTNAAKYTEPGGRIAVAARRDAQTIVLVVRDNGRGIPAELLPHIFDMFVQDEQALDRSRGGLGIGLTLVRNLTERHGGSVSARSEGHDRGSEFEIRLPAAEAPVAAPAATERATKSGRTQRVLVVDDNEDAAELIGEALRRQGHEVVVAFDGPQALVTARTFDATVGLLDIGLPVMDGYELASRLRAQSARPIRLIALSGYGQDVDRTRSRDAGFDVHLVKPVDLRELLRLLAEGD